MTSCSWRVHSMIKITAAIICALWTFTSPRVAPAVKKLNSLGEGENELTENGLFGNEGSHGFACKLKLNQHETVLNFQKYKKRILILDYDGTIAEFHPDREKAVPSDALVEVLGKLNEDHAILVAIISGRDWQFLNKHFGHYGNFLLSAEHGAFTRPPQMTQWDRSKTAEGLDDSWKGQVENIMSEMLKFKHTNIETKDTGIVFHYRSAELKESEEKLIVDHISNELKKMQLDTYLILENDAKAIDVRPKYLTKGGIAVSTCERRPDAEMIICIGDGHTDEAMFQSIRDFQKQSQIITVHVENGAGKDTHADYLIENVQSVVNLLRAFYGLPSKEVGYK